MNKETKTCQNCKTDFTIEPEDFSFYEKIKVPPPTWCPECRFQRRILWRNERKLFRNKSAKTGKSILSLAHPDSGMTIYDQEEWWKDDWDATTYGKEYNPSKPFLAQFGKLMREVPYYSRVVMSMENSDYCGNANALKNCYLLFNSNHSEDCSYGNAVDDSKSCIDNSHIAKTENSYSSFWLTGCHGTRFSAECEECVSTWFSKNCRGCTNCVGCVNLRNKQYCIFNEQYTKEEYEKKVTEMKLDTWSGMKIVEEKAKKFWLFSPNKYDKGSKNVDSVGTYINNSKNVKYGYLVRGGEDCKHIQYMEVPTNKSCYDHSVWGQNNELSYECAVCGLGTFGLKFCFDCGPDVSNLEYSMCCKSSSDLFGCVGMKKKQYCILNKQYTKEEYGKLRTQIIKDMTERPYVDKMGRAYPYGEFFPPEISPYAYNETIAPEHFPLTQKEAEEQGYTWREPAHNEYEITKDSSDLEDSIEDANEGILKEIIRCEKCKRAYRIIKHEFDFLKSQGIPLPRTCVECRHQERISIRLKAHFYKRPCQCTGSNSDNKIYTNTATHTHGTEPCPTEFETSYAPDRPEIVYCEACYQQEVV